jgi:hypothetical protein
MITYLVISDNASNGLEDVKGRELMITGRPSMNCCICCVLKMVLDE